MGDFNPAMLAEDLKSLGFRLHENVSPKDIERYYLKGRKDNVPIMGTLYVQLLNN